MNCREYLTGVGSVPASVVSIFIVFYPHPDFPGGKASVYNAGDPGSVPGSGRSPGEGNGNPLQYSCLENPMDRGAWWATVLGVAKSRTRLTDFTFTLSPPQPTEVGIMMRKPRPNRLSDFPRVLTR